MVSQLVVSGGACGPTRVRWFTMVITDTKHSYVNGLQVVRGIAADRSDRRRYAMVEISYRIPTHKGEVLGFIWIRITTRVPEVLVNSILKNNDIPPMERDFGYSVHDLDFERLVEIKYPIKDRFYPTQPIWTSIEEIASLEDE